VSLFPVLAPFLLLALGIWWVYRRVRQKDPLPTPAAAASIPPEK